MFNTNTAPNTHSVAWMRCTFSAGPGRRCCIRYGQHRPRSQQIYHEAKQRTQTLTLGRAAYSSAAVGRHFCPRHGSDRLRSQQIQRQLGGTSVPGTARIASGHNRSIATHCFKNTQSVARRRFSRPWTALRYPLWSASAKSPSKITVSSSSATCFRPRHFWREVSRAPVGRARMRLLAHPKGSLINTRRLPCLRLQSERQALQRPLLKSFCVSCVISWTMSGVHTSPVCRMSLRKRKLQAATEPKLRGDGATSHATHHVTRSVAHAA